MRRLHDLRDHIHGSLDTLYGRLRAALDESLADTPAEPDLPDTGSTAALDDSRPRPSRPVVGHPRALSRSAS